MNVIIVAIIVLIALRFAAQGHKKNNVGLSRIMLGIASFLMGATVATLVLDFVIPELLPSDYYLNMAVRITLVVGFVWLAYRFLKARFLSAPKDDRKDSPLDAHLGNKGEQ
jgi:hypothetical protein